MKLVNPPGLSSVHVGIGLIFVTPQNGIIRYSYSLTEPRTNNEAEYEALIAGLEMATSLDISHLIDRIVGPDSPISPEKKSDSWTGQSYQPRNLKSNLNIACTLK